jgi:hypothetical protein
VLVKTEFAVVLGSLVKEAKLGLFLGDGALVCISTPTSLPKLMQPSSPMIPCSIEFD